MPSTAQGNLGEVIGLLSPSTSTSTPPTAPTIPPFRRRPPLTAKSHSRLDFITLPRRRPPLSSRAACARFRLARKKSSSSHLTIATSPTIIIHPEAELQAFTTRISSKIDSLNHDLCATLSILNILDIHLRHLASSSIPSCYISDASTHILLTHPSGRIGHPVDRRAAGDQPLRPLAAPRPLS
ncbi:hypothetical protein R3P38DRAFT_3192567 [Favolaschia claudopus]|uniref:Uncharacterized protein n=1 Tax=Favolaschia claudopus TaxID=2862362 RepID=A0AAW0BI66_9AGAR